MHSNPYLAENAIDFIHIRLNWQKVEEIISNNENEDESDDSEEDRHYDCDDINTNDY